jgi:hypothetical protein
MDEAIEMHGRVTKQSAYRSRDLPSFGAVPGAVPARPSALADVAVGEDRR